MKSEITEKNDEFFSVMERNVKGNMITQRFLERLGESQIFRYFHATSTSHRTLRWKFIFYIHSSFSGG